MIVSFLDEVSPSSCTVVWYHDHAQPVDFLKKLFKSSKNKLISNKTRNVLTSLDERAHGCGC